MFNDKKTEQPKVETYAGDISIKIDAFNPPQEVFYKDAEGQVARDEFGVELTREVSHLVVLAGEILDQEGNILRTIQVKNSDLVADVEIRDLVVALVNRIYGKFAEDRPDLNHVMGEAPKAETRRKAHHHVKKNRQRMADNHRRSAEKSLAYAEQAEKANRNKKGGASPPKNPNKNKK